jgi:hypothetical protein
MAQTIPQLTEVPEPIDVAKEWRTNAERWASIAEKQMERIQRAVALLQRAERYDAIENSNWMEASDRGEWVRASVISQVQRILEGKQ